MQIQFLKIVFLQNNFEVHFGCSSNYSYILLNILTRPLRRSGGGAARPPREAAGGAARGLPGEGGAGDGGGRPGRHTAEEQSEGGAGGCLKC